VLARSGEDASEPRLEAIEGIPERWEELLASLAR
jgi:hypothetical protein